MAPLLLAALPAVMQGVQGIGQMIAGRNKIKDLERPEYEIPAEVKQALAISRANYADPTMPGQQTMYDRNALASANAARASIEGGGGLSSLAGMAAAESQGAQNIGIAGANFQNQQELQYQGQLQNMADYKDQQFQINELAPYTEKYNEGREQIGAGQQNLFGALGSIAKVGLAQLMNPTAPTTAEMGAQAAGDVGQTSSINRIVEQMQSFWGDGAYGSKAYEVAKRVGAQGGYSALKSAYDAQQQLNAGAGAYESYLNRPQ